MSANSHTAAADNVQYNAVLYGTSAAVIRWLQMVMNAAARLVVGACKYMSTSSQSSMMCFTPYQYVNGYHIRWLSLPFTMSMAMAQPTFDRSACRSLMSLVGYISALPNVMICWFVGPELSLADKVFTLQLQSSGTCFWRSCALPPLVTDNSEMRLKPISSHKPHMIL